MSEEIDGDDDVMACGVIVAIPLAHIEAVNNMVELCSLVRHHMEKGHSELIEAVLKRRSDLCGPLPTHKHNG